MTKFDENHYRTIAKTISWRVSVTVSHFINGLIVTGSVSTAIVIASWTALINSCFYWLHERIWNHFSWSRQAVTNIFFVDGHPRTTTKMLTWRVIVSFTTFLIPYFTTGSVGQAAAFFTIGILVNMGLFYAHERVWNIIKWGKKLNKD